MATKVQRIMTQPIVRQPRTRSVQSHAGTAESSALDSSSRSRVAKRPHQPHALTSRSTISKRLSRSFPQNLIFRFLQTKARIQIWLFENVDVVMEGRIIVRPGSCFRNNPPPRSCLARRAPVRASFQTPLSPLG
jgi:hypothetical protein